MSEKSVFDIFKNDHEQFKTIFSEGLNNLRLTKNLKLAYLLSEYCNLFLETYHHEAEETCLFKKVAQNPKIKNGGPECTYFYDVQMANNPLLKVYRELGIKDYVIRTEHIPKAFEEEFKNKLPVVIPLEEHIAGKILLEEIHNLISKESNIDRIIELFELYYNIQIFHFKKEESCFFEMCASLISSDDLLTARIYANSKQAQMNNEILPLTSALSLKIQL